jgi:hypothetical protein
VRGGGVAVEAAAAGGRASRRIAVAGPRGATVGTAALGAAALGAAALGAAALGAAALGAAARPGPVDAALGSRATKASAKAWASTSAASSGSLTWTCSASSSAGPEPPVWTTWATSWAIRRWPRSLSGSNAPAAK